MELSKKTEFSKDEERRKEWKHASGWGIKNIQVGKNLTISICTCLCFFQSCKIFFSQQLKVALWAEGLISQRIMFSISFATFHLLHLQNDFFSNSICYSLRLKTSAEWLRSLCVFTLEQRCERGDQLEVVGQRETGAVQVGVLVTFVHDSRTAGLGPNTGGRMHEWDGLRTLTERHTDRPPLFLTVNREFLESSAMDSPKCLTGTDVFPREISGGFDQ